MKAIVLVGLAVAGCSAQSGDDGYLPGAHVSDAVTGASGATQYVDIVDFAGTDTDAWFALTAKLAQEFGALCGDSFCEGDYPNLTPLTFMCSVTSKAGDVKDCGWTFAGSVESVDPRTSIIASDAATFQCHVAPKTTGGKLIALLTTSADALHEPLPGTSGSIYDSLVECFQHPIGAAPIAASPSDPNPEYVEASDYYTSAKNKAAWAGAKAAAVNGFNQICGDTYCSSDYGDLQSLDLACSITKSTGNVKDCMWVFGGSVPFVTTTSSAVAETSQAFKCHLPMKGTLAALISVWTAPGTDNAIQRTLPGETTSAYDAIGNDCLP